jgi:hypothetical protein
LREYQELSATFHADMSFKDFCTIKHPEWYEPQVSVDKKVKVPRKKVDGAYGEVSQSTDVEDSTSYLSSDAHDDEGVLAPKYDEDSMPYPIYDTYGDASMIVPKYDEDWVFEKLSCDIDLSSQEPCMEDDKEGVDLVDENKSEILYEDDSPHESHHCMVSSSKSIGVDEELCYQLSLARSSSLTTTKTPSSLAAVTPEGMSSTHDLREEPLMMSPDEEHSELQVLEESLDCTLIWHCGGEEPFLLESSLEGQSLATKEMVEHLPCGPTREEAYASMDWVDRYMMDMDTLWGTGLVIINRVLDSVAHTGHWMVQEDTGVCHNIHGIIHWHMVVHIRVLECFL